MRLVITARCLNPMCAKVHVHVIEGVLGDKVLLGDDSDLFLGAAIEMEGLRMEDIIGLHMIEETEPLCAFDIAHADASLLLTTMSYGARRIVS